MKATRKSTGGTSFHKVTVRATVNALIAAIGSYHETDGDKTNFEWNMETKSGEVFTIYDWKNYSKIDKENTLIDWHIGSHSEKTSIEAYEELVDALSNSFANKKKKVLALLEVFTAQYDEFSKMVSTKHYRTGTGQDFNDLAGIRERIKTYTEITEIEKTTVEEWELGGGKVRV